MKTLLSYRNVVRIVVVFAVFVATLGFTSTVGAQSNCGATYIVQPGDYLTKIARTCGVSYSDLLKANPTITNPSRIYPGQVIKIPSTTNPPSGSIPGVYKVKRGDTLFGIAQAFQLSVTELREANPDLGTVLKPGLLLNIPARIQFATGGTAAIVSGHLEANSEHYYLVNAGAEQTLEVTGTAASRLTLAIFGADGTTRKSASRDLFFRGVLPRTQDYILVLASGNRATDYSLSLDIPARIRFATGGTSATLTGTVPANLSQFFILRASKGQTLHVTATPQSKLQLIIYGVDGSVLRSGMGEGASFTGILPSTQDYILVLKSANQVQDFTLKVSIPAESVPVSGTGKYTVKKGDTLNSIAVRYHTTVAALLRGNPGIANRNVIYVGQIIYLPGATITLSDGQVIYLVNHGDTMGTIAKKFNITLSALIEANPQISNPSLIFPGGRILIP